MISMSLFNYSFHKASPASLQYRRYQSLKLRVYWTRLTKRGASSAGVALALSNSKRPSAVSYKPVDEEERDEIESHAARPQ